MKSTTKKAQELDKKGTNILSTFEQVEADLTAHLKLSTDLSIEITQEINQKQAMLDSIENQRNEHSTVLQNIRMLLGKEV